VLGRARLTGSPAAQLTHRAQDAAGVFRRKGNGTSVELDPVLPNSVGDEAVGFRRDADDLAQVEVVGTELVEVLNEPVSLGPAEAEVAGTEVRPIRGPCPKELVVANLAEALDVGGRAAAGDEAECLPSAEPVTERKRVDLFDRQAGGGFIVISWHSRPKTAQICAVFRTYVLETKDLIVLNLRNLRQNLRSGTSVPRMECDWFRVRSRIPTTSGWAGDGPNQRSARTSMIAHTS